jgi:hypothetical protein
MACYTSIFLRETILIYKYDYQTWLLLITLQANGGDSAFCTPEPKDRTYCLTRLYLKLYKDRSVIVIITLGQTVLYHGSQHANMLENSNNL